MLSFKLSSGIITYFLKPRKIFCSLSVHKNLKFLLFINLLILYNNSGETQLKNFSVKYLQSLNVKVPIKNNNQNSSSEQDL